MVDESKRRFLKHCLRDRMADVVAGVREGMQAGDRKTAFDRCFDSYESSYALTLAYPDDILLETARRHGIDTDGRGWEIGYPFFDCLIGMHAFAVCRAPFFVGASVNPLWWDLAITDYQSELTSTCGCAEPGHNGCRSCHPDILERP